MAISYGAQVCYYIIFTDVFVGVISVPYEIFFRIRSSMFKMINFVDGGAMEFCNFPNYTISRIFILAGILKLFHDKSTN